jgi:hypothetical protein
MDERPLVSKISSLVNTEKHYNRCWIEVEIEVIFRKVVVAFLPDCYYTVDSKEAPEQETNFYFLGSMG